MLQVMLTAHNAARAEVGIANGRFEHSPGSSRPNQGENLWAGTASAFSFQDMVDGWINEKRFFVADTFPDVSTAGRWQDVGHYTQIIWRGTTKIGYGIADNSRPYRKRYQ